MARVPVNISVADPATGAALAGVSATIKHRATATNLTLYAAETGGSTLTNPVTTDANGRALAYVDRAPLRIDYSGTGLTPWTEHRDVGPSSDRGLDSLLLPLGALPALVTALPSTPSDGEEVYYQSAAMAAEGELWHLRYRAAAAGSYKWEVVAAAALENEVVTAANETTALSAYTALTTPGPSIALPLAGDYDVEISMLASHAVANVGMIMSYDIGGTGASDLDSATVSSNVVNVAHLCRRVRRKTGLAAVTLTAKYRTGSGTMSVIGSASAGAHRLMRATPIRVG